MGGGGRGLSPSQSLAARRTLFLVHLPWSEGVGWWWWDGGGSASKAPHTDPHTETVTHDEYVNGKPIADGQTYRGGALWR